MNRAIIEVRVDSIPQELRDRPQWVAWRLEERDGKATKVPYHSDGKRASSTDPERWMTCEKAVEAAARLKCDGIGFVFSADDPYHGTDLDKAVDPETEELKPWAVEILNDLDSYSEFSPSGSGVHVITRAEQPGGKGRKTYIDKSSGEAVEMYGSGRYFTITGSALVDYPPTIHDRSAEIAAIYSRIFSNNGAKQKADAPRNEYHRTEGLSDDALIAKFKTEHLDLWEGRWKDIYPSQSEADLALYTLLAALCLHDRERMLRIARLSGLVRDKWDREDYIAGTIDKAVENARNTEQAKSLEAYFDYRRNLYLVHNSRGGWTPLNETSFKRILRSHGYRKKLGEGERVSEVEAFLLRVQTSCDVKYAGPLAGTDEGFYETNGERYLVTSSPRIIEPQPGSWPTLKQLFEGLLSDPEHDQLTYLYGWLKVAYETLSTRGRRPGQALCFAGPHASGKSLLQAVITQILGGRSAKPYQYMTNLSSFNADLFEAEHLTLEDEQASTDIRTRRNFGSQIKNVTVNAEQRCHAKNRDAVMLRPFWRLSVSLNDEPENLMVLPPMDDSLEDKIILLRGYRNPMPMPTATNEEKELFWQTLMDELPAFIHYLTEFEIPVHLVSERFGITHFHHPDLVRELDALAPEYRLLTMIETEILKDRDEWSGTAEEMERELRHDQSDVKQEAGRLLTFNTACGVYLARLSKRIPERISYKRHTHLRTWTITVAPPDDGVSGCSSERHRKYKDKERPTHDGWD